MKGGNESFARYVPPTPFDWSEGNNARPFAYFDIDADGKSLGRLKFELAGDVVPKTVENFMKLCADGKYKGTPFHRVIKDSAILGGDVENKDGTGSHSAFETRYFEDENYIIPHSERGLLSMVTSGVHSNGSQFCLALEPMPHLNGRNVVFGRMVQGDDVIEEITSIYTFRGVPAKRVTITDSGVEEA